MCCDGPARRSQRKRILPHEVPVQAFTHLYDSSHNRFLCLTRCGAPQRVRSGHSARITDCQENMPGGDTLLPIFREIAKSVRFSIARTSFFRKSLDYMAICV